MNLSGKAACTTSLFFMHLNGHVTSQGKYNNYASINRAAFKML